MLVAALLLGYGALRTSNHAAADRLAGACIRLRDVRDTWWAENETTFARLLGDDLDFVRELFLGLGEGPCREVEPRLRQPFVLGARQTWQGEPWSADRLAELREVIARARERCVPMFVELFSNLAALGPDAAPPDIPAAAEAACTDMTTAFERYGSLDREATEPIALTEWPEQIEALARSLESVADDE